MRRASKMELDHLNVTLFERNGEPWIKFTFVGTDGEETEVETQLDCKCMVIRFNDDQPTPQPKGVLN